MPDAPLRVACEVNCPFAYAYKMALVVLCAFWLVKILQGF